MFCPYCNKNNKEDAVFCAYCQKALPKNVTQTTENAEPEPVAAESEPPVQEKPKKNRLSFTAVKGIITILLIAGLVLAIIWLYYPHLLGM
jgi:uncharacterized membrane protein YvbJ